MPEIHDSSMHGLEINNMCGNAGTRDFPKAGLAMLSRERSAHDEKRIGVDKIAMLRRGRAASQPLCACFHLGMHKLLEWWANGLHGQVNRCNIARSGGVWGQPTMFWETVSSHQFLHGCQTD
jgi:hypothetical protein